MTVLALRIDVDTHDGLRVGVPRMLELLRRVGVRATFFVTFGPDRAGLALTRAWSPSFLWKMARTRALNTYGWRTVLSGTLLPARRVGESFGSLLRDVTGEGHELGLHGYDHFGWQRGIRRMRPSEIEAALRAGVDAFTRTVGRPPAATAAPGWRTTLEALAVQERFGFTYASDTRGQCAFRVRTAGTTYDTLQIPTTMPTTDEIAGVARRVSTALESVLRSGLNVFTAHAEVDGGPLLGEFERFLCRVQLRGTEIVRLIDAAEMLLSDRDGIPATPVECGRVRGRSGWVLVQRSSMDREFASDTCGNAR